MINIGIVKISRKRFSLLILLLCILLLLGSALFVSMRLLHSSQSPLSSRPTRIQPSVPGHPVLERLEQVTDQAFGNANHYVPNSWGAHKNRIIRTSSGDLFTVYISEGSDEQNRIWHLMHRAPDGGGWQEIQSGNAGAEPINILRGLHDEIHLFAWPGTNGQLQHIVSTDLGKSFRRELVPGQWNNSQGYSGAGINDKGNIVVFQTGPDKPGAFLWAYYTPDNNSWQFHTAQTDVRYTYPFILPGDNNDLMFTAMRDVKRTELGYPQASGDADARYIFNEIKYFSISDVNNPNNTFSQTQIKEVEPQQDTDSDITYLVDTYIDTIGRTHILYTNLYDGPGFVHHAIVQHGKIIKDVKLAVSLGRKARIIQDSQGHFYITTMDGSGQTLNIYPGSASDTDGTQLDQPVKLDISRFPGCSDDDFCHAPTFTVPRNGHALSDEIDGVYGNFNHEIYFRIQLRGGSNSHANIWRVPFENRAF